MKKLLMIFVINLIILNASYAQNKVSNEIKQIDRYVKTINRITRKQKEPNLIFADISQTTKEKWNKFSSTKSLEKFMEDHEVDIAAYVWRKNGHIITSKFTLTSQSGDWFTYVNYYFRQNGRLAKIEFEHRTFYGSFVALQSFYFNEKGKILKKIIQYLDLYTDKPKTIKPDTIDKSYLKTDVYRKANNLPFAFLLSKK